MANEHPGEARRFILTLSCPDRRGIVADVAGFLAGNECNIVESAQFGDDDGSFFMRVSFDAEGAVADTGKLNALFAPVAERYGMEAAIHRADARPRVVIMVSRFGHCLNDLLFRHQGGTLPMDVRAVVSNHRDFEALTGSYGVPFFHVRVSPETKAQAEKQLMDLVEREKVELVVLARYMQVLSPELCQALRGRAINIHHSFLPGFKGAKPYHQAHRRGVKLIGATAHYVTEDLDEGPIIEQDVARVNHAMSADELVERGRDIECSVLARALQWHLERRVLLNGTRTVVFR